MQNWMAVEAVYAHIYSAMYTDPKWMIKNASIILALPLGASWYKVASN